MMPEGTRGSVDAVELTRCFGEHFGTPPPTHLASAPGRVNLIGEHIDYNGLSVFPMAINRSVTVLFRSRSDNRVRLANHDSRFHTCEFSLDRDIPKSPTGDWGNYVKAAGQALVRRCGALTGFDGLVSSTVPVAAGLSSSSALVIASGLCTLQANGLSIDPFELADLMAQGERYVGTQGGGMDQAISLAARPGTASRVDFDPVRLTPTTVPRNWRFVVAHTLVHAAKSGNVQQRYNQRTEECRRALGLICDELGDVAEPSYRALTTRYSVTELLHAAGEVLPEELFKRFRHVVTESDRVERAVEAMAAGDLDGFGRLMRESHLSLRDDYEVSSAELDELTAIAESAGARGARLTGAGMGGCAIALCDEGDVWSTLEALAQRFYAARNLEGPLEDRLFVAEPSGGATVSEVRRTDGQRESPKG